MGGFERLLREVVGGEDEGGASNRLRPDVQKLRALCPLVLPLLISNLRFEMRDFQLIAANPKANGPSGRLRVFLP
jgi:hypothetical protein